MALLTFKKFITGRTKQPEFPDLMLVTIDSESVFKIEHYENYKTIYYKIGTAYEYINVQLTNEEFDDMFYNNMHKKYGFVTPIFENLKKLFKQKEYNENPNL